MDPFFRNNRSEGFCSRGMNARAWNSRRRREKSGEYVTNDDLAEKYPDFNNY
jgi:hypothetical protein